MNRGFSLVELSIVLVILGLLTGGILAGQSLIRAAELRMVSTEFNRYVSAINSFRDKYMALPGDMPNATLFWGTGTCPGTNASPSTTAATCNGNGNGRINPIVATANESFRFWHHLANAGLIEGSYSGVPNSATYSDQTVLIGTNTPPSKLSSASWFTIYLGPVTVANVVYFEGPYSNNILFGTISNGSIAAALKPEEAWNIDTKLDDGKPGTGIVTTFESQTTCHDAGTSNSVALASSANYDLVGTAIACSLIFKPGY